MHYFSKKYSNALNMQIYIGFSKFIRNINVYVLGRLKCITLPIIIIPSCYEYVFVA